jgi:tRNA pseudouridine32 synthase / 23S rRNA pseudouridine746 synthase
MEAGGSDPTNALKRFDPQPSPDELPALFPSPFATPPHPLAHRAALLLQEHLRANPPVDVDRDGTTSRGRMYGVMVVEDSQRQVGFLSGFSGLINDGWSLPGFVGATCDAPLRDRIWAEHRASIASLTVEIDSRTSGAEAQLRTEIESLKHRQASAADALRVVHLANRQQRKAQRETSSGAADPRRLENESRADEHERKQQRARAADELGALQASLNALIAERRVLEEMRTTKCTQTLHAIQDAYAILNFAGKQTPIRTLFAPREPPGGAGDCAAPKLLTHACRNGLRPLAMAEFWWGPPPEAGDRREGTFYPACRGKCGPLLSFMLQGLTVAKTAIPGSEPVLDDQPRTIFEDAYLLVVEKPCGLLSVPGRGRELKDSAYLRLKERHPEFTGPLLVHRLDLDTSGVLLVAKDEQTYKALQRMFTLREIEKRYIAWVEGSPKGDSGSVTLALRGDLDDRPRQIHDPVDGKPAVTDWQVLQREPGRTRIALHPRTGRTHQLRLHCAHPLGLNAPIVGDRLYGILGDRMMLHAESLRFIHPHTGDTVSVEWKSPF